MLATLPGRTQGLGLITEPMLRDLQLDRVTYANINLWATLLGAVVCLPIGRLFDRVGLRGATFALTLLLGAVVWTMSRLAGGALMLFLLVLATRALGQSALSVASITAVGKSFDRRVGVAMGVYSVLLSLFFAAAFTAVGTSVRVSGWRTAWAQVAFGLVLFAAPVVLLLRERPAPTVIRSQAKRRSDAGAVPGGGASHAGVLGVRWRDVAVRPGLVRSGTLQRSRPRGAWLRSADLRQVSGGDVDHRPGRSAGVRLAHAPLVDAAPARPGDVHLRGRRSRHCRCSRPCRSSGSSPR